MIGGVGAPDDVGGQAALGFVPRKRLERRGREYAAEIPNHRLDRHFPRSAQNRGRRLPWNAGVTQPELPLGEACRNGYFCRMKFSIPVIAALLLLASPAH